MAPSDCAGSAAMPVLSEVAETVGKIRIVHEIDRQAGERRFDALALMAGDHDHRPRLRGERLLDGDANERAAADLGQELVRAAHAGRAAGGEHDRRNAGGTGCSGSSRGCGRVTISMSSPPTPMPVMSSRGTGSPASEPHQHPVEAVLLRAARAAGRAEHRRARPPRRSTADCRDRPACRNARCGRRSPRAPRGSRRADRRWPTRRRR